MLKSRNHNIWILNINNVIFKLNLVIYSLPVIIIKGFRAIVFIVIVISTRFRPIYLPVFLRCLSNSGTFTELWTTSFIESTGVACSDSVSQSQVQVFSILVLLLACSQDWACNLQMIVSWEAGQFRENFWDL